MQKLGALKKSLLLMGGVGAILVLTFRAKSEEPLSAVDEPIIDGEVPATVAASEYTKWVKPYQSRPPIARFGDKMSPVKVVVTVIEGDKPVPPGKREYEMFGKQVSYGCQVSASGVVGHFYFSSRGAKGSGYAQISAPDLKRLDHLLAHLPDDSSRLPPPNRRLVVQALDVSGELRVRVYDRANAPSQVLDILRLTLSGIRSSVPEFVPASQWNAQRSGQGALGLSRDGRAIISSSWFGPIKAWDRNTYKLLRQVETGNSMAIEGLALSPNQPVAAIPGGGDITLLNTQTWQKLRVFTEPSINGVRQGLSAPQFTSDGRLLLVRSSQPTLLVYDTKSWKRIAMPSDWPKAAISYFPSIRTNRAIYGAKDGTVALWDAKQQRMIAKLDQKARVHHVAFSPDKSHVAVVTVHQGPSYHWSEYRIGIWKADTGALVHELKPFEQGTCESVEGLLWSPDGRYVLAPTKADSFFTSRGISVWSAESGRHRGEFSGCPSELTGLVLLPNGRLIAGCEDGKIRVWDTIPALKSISEFEASLRTERNS